MFSSRVGTLGGRLSYMEALKSDAQNLHGQSVGININVLNAPILKP